MMYKVSDEVQACTAWGEWKDATIDRRYAQKEPWDYVVRFAGGTTYNTLHKNVRDRPIEEESGMYKVGDKVQTTWDIDWVDCVIHRVCGQKEPWDYVVKFADGTGVSRKRHEIRDRPTEEEEMATYTSRTSTETVYEYLIPFPANHTEVSKAWMAAEKRYKVLKDVPFDQNLSDDAIWFVPNDEYVCIQFKVTKDN